MFGLGPSELAIIVLIILLLFGGRIIKNTLSAAGETVRELRKIGKEIEEDQK